MLPYSPLFCSTLDTNVASVLLSAMLGLKVDTLCVSPRSSSSHTFPREGDPEVAAGLLVTMPALCSSSFVVRPQFLGVWSVWTRRTVTVAALVVDNGRLCTRMVLLVRCITRCVSLCCRQAQGARHFCRVAALVADFGSGMAMAGSWSRQFCSVDVQLRIGAFWEVLHIRCRAWSRVHRDTGPQISCICGGISTKTCHLLHRPHHNHHNTDPRCHSVSCGASLQRNMEQNVDVPVPRGRRFPPWTGLNSVWWSRSRRNSGSACASSIHSPGAADEAWEFFFSELFNK